MPFTKTIDNPTTILIIALSFAIPIHGVDVVVVRQDGIVCPNSDVFWMKLDMIVSGGFRTKMILVAYYLADALFNTSDKTTTF